MDPIHPKTRLTLQVLGGYENIRVWFRVLISDYFQIQVDVRSASGHIYPTSEPDFFKKKKKKPCSLLVKYFQRNKKWKMRKPQACDFTCKCEERNEQEKARES